MTGEIKMPKAGIKGKAGHHWLAKIGDRVTDEPASTAAAMLAGGRGFIMASAFAEVLTPLISSGAGNFTPDLESGFDFVRTLTGVTTILFPENIPEDALPFFSVLVIQDATGGWAVSYGEEFLGAEPVLFDGAGDWNLVGFKVLSRDPDYYTAWTVKGIEATV